MYCTILHGDPARKSGIVTDERALNGEPKKDTLLYVNPDCALQILLDHIRHEVEIDPNQEFDLCDINGELKYVNDFEPGTNAATILEPFGRYICVLTYRNEKGVLFKVIPLVNSTYSEMSLKLRKSVKMSKRFSHDVIQVSAKSTRREPSIGESSKNKSSRSISLSLRKKSKHKTN